MASKKFVDVVKWFRRISLVIGWLGDSISKFPDLNEEEPNENDNEDNKEDEG